MGEQYEGFYNHPTWLMNLIITNDKDELDFWMDKIKQYRYDKAALVAQLRKVYYADRRSVESMIDEERTATVMRQFAKDYFSDGVDGIYWDEIADELLSKYNDIVKFKEA